MSSRAWLARSLKSRSGLLQWALLIAAVAFVAWIITTRGDDLKAAFELTPRIFILITLSAFGTFALNGIELQVLAGKFGRRIPFRDGQLLGLMVSTLNYLPMKTGTVLNGVIMRARFGLPLTDFAALVAGSSVIHLWVGLSMAGVSLLFDPATAKWGLLLLCPTAVVFALVLWGRVRRGARSDSQTSRLTRGLSRVVNGVGMIFSDARLLAIEFAINVALIALWSARSYWAFEAIGVDASYGSVLTMSALGILFARLSVIPGGVGFREAGAAFGSAITGLSASLGFAATVLDRAVMLTWLLIIGVPGAVYLLKITGVGLDDAVRGAQDSSEGNTDGTR